MTVSHHDSSSSNLFSPLTDSQISASWLDHARDLLHMTNVFRAQMPRPIVGVGHSFGGNILVHLGLMHPRLLSALVMIDPVLTRTIRAGPLYGFATMRASAGRRDLWPTRADAERSVRRNPFYATWDPRAVDRLVRVDEIAPNIAMAGNMLLIIPVLIVFFFVRRHIMSAFTYTGVK